jgi:hypothetical protein
VNIPMPRQAQRDRHPTDEETENGADYDGRFRAEIVVSFPSGRGHRRRRHVSPVWAAAQRILKLPENRRPVGQTRCPAHTTALRPEHLSSRSTTGRTAETLISAYGLWLPTARLVNGGRARIPRGNDICPSAPVPGPVASSAMWHLRSGAGPATTKNRLVTRW